MDNKQKNDNIKILLKNLMDENKRLKDELVKKELEYELYRKENNESYEKTKNLLNELTTIMKTYEEGIDEIKKMKDTYKSSLREISMVKAKYKKTVDKLINEIS